MLNVGISEYKIVKYPDKIRAIGLGSCCGIVLYDDFNKIAGMVHILLDEYKGDSKLVNKAKYANLGIELLYNEMEKMGANKRLIKAKIAGGACMFNVSDKKNSIFTVGERNVKATKHTLAKLRIPIISEDTLGNTGRTIIFDTETNKLLIKVIGVNEKYI